MRNWRINGTGYPRNLKGDEIIMEARIMAVADVVEAIASHRPYLDRPWALTSPWMKLRRIEELFTAMLSQMPV